MKKQFIGFLILTCLGAFSWAQGTKDLFDTRKSQEELEIMKGILGTTMSFVSQNLQRQADSAATTKSGQFIYSWRGSNINAFYLYGQGAVFMIPSSSIRMSGFLSGDRFALAGANIDNLSAELARAAAEMDRAAVVVGGVQGGVSGGVAGGVQGGVGSGAATAAPRAVQTPKPPAPPAQAQNPEELRKKLAEQVERSKKSREDMLANREKLMKTLGEMKGYLIETLANYGDSLTTVKPSEFINVVLSADDSDFFAIANSDISPIHRQIISVQKSWITDYKAGRLSMDAFKQKALQYNQ
jgi:hypothetical protein